MARKILIREPSDGHGGGKGSHPPKRCRGGTSEILTKGVRKANQNGPWGPDWGEKGMWRPGKDILMKKAKWDTITLGNLGVRFKMGG